MIRFGDGSGRAPCDLEDHGESADDVINAQDRHLKKAEKSGDATHPGGPRRHEEPLAAPEKSMGWYRDVKRAFATLPETDSALSFADVPRHRDGAPMRSLIGYADSACRVRTVHYGL